MMTSSTHLISMDSGGAMIYGIHLEPRMLFASRALAWSGIANRVVCMRPEDHVVDADESDCFKWLKNARVLEVEFACRDAPFADPCDASLVFVRGAASAADRQWLLQVSSGSAKRVAMLRFAPESRMWQIRQVVKEFKQPFLRKFDALWTEDVHLPWLRLLLGKPHRYYGVLPSQRCTTNSEAMSLLYAPRIAGKRQFLFSWAGSANYRREPIATWVETRLERETKPWVFRSSHAMTGEPVAWNHGQHVAFDEYLRDLENSWFCLCLPGFTGTSNRTLECILRGAIPVIQEEEVPFTRLPLRDGVNAILVRDSDWPEAITRLAKTTIEERLAMQGEVIKLAVGNASVDSLARSLVEDLLGPAGEFPKSAP
jgi:hypothetical protein